MRKGGPQPPRDGVTGAKNTCRAEDSPTSAAHCFSEECSSISIKYTYVHFAAFTT